MNKDELQFSHQVSVPPGEGVRVDKTVTIERPPAVVYDYWKDLENLPCFLRNLQCVEVRDKVHSHWRAKGLPGQSVEWDAEIIEQRANEMISWRSVPGSDVDHAGSVWFTPSAGNNGTNVRVELRYVPPAGKAGHSVAGVFGRDAECEIEEDLARLKIILETGKTPEELAEPGFTEQAADAARRWARATDQCVRTYPWAAIATSSAASLVAGFLIARFSRRRARLLKE